MHRAWELYWHNGSFAGDSLSLWVTSLVSTAGFPVVSQSAFQVNSGMGLLTAITIAIALIADMLFLSPLLMAVDRDSAAPSDTSSSAHAT